MNTSDTLSRALITSADDEPTIDECNVEHLSLIDDELRDNLKLVASHDTIQQIQTAPRHGRNVPRPARHNKIGLARFEETAASMHSDLPWYQR